METRQMSTKRAGASTIHCSAAVAQAIVQPLLEMSLLVMELDHRTKRQALAECAQRLRDAKSKLAALMEGKFQRPVAPERLFNLSVTTNPRIGGHFELSVTETTPSKEGNTSETHRLRLCGSGAPSTLERFAAFVHANNPQLNQPFDMARELIDAVGI